MSCSFISAFRELSNLSSGAVAIYKWVNTLELKMEQCNTLDNAHRFLALLILGEKIGHLRLYQIRLHRLGISTHNTHGDTAIYAFIIGLMH